MPKVYLQSSFTLSASLSLTVSQNPSQNLPARAFWNYIYKLNTSFEPLVMRLLLLKVVVNFFHQLGVILEELASIMRCEHHKSFWDLSSGLIWHWNDCCISNKRVADQTSLELGWCNLVSLKVGL